MQSRIWNLESGIWNACFAKRPATRDRPLGIAQRPLGIPHRPLGIASVPLHAECFVASVPMTMTSCRVPGGGSSGGGGGGGTFIWASDRFIFHSEISQFERAVTPRSPHPHPHILVLRQLIIAPHRMPSRMATVGCRFMLTCCTPLNALLDRYACSTFKLQHPTHIIYKLTGPHRSKRYLGEHQQG